MDIKKYFSINVIGGGKRQPEVDVAKGIGIYLVVLAHCCGDSLMGNLINSFHMPLFFFLSGLFLFRKEETFRHFVVKKAKSLLFPCLLFGIILSTYSTIMDAMRGDGTIPIGLRYIGLFINTRHNPYPGSLWFFLALFLIEFMLYFLHKSIYSNVCRIIVVIALAMIGCTYNYYIKEGLPWSLDIAIICMLFTEVGYQCKFYGLIGNVNISKTIVALLLFVSAFYLNEILLGHDVNLFSSDYGCYPLFYIAAFSGTYLMYSLSCQLKRSAVLQYLGQNSLLIYALHFLLLLVVSKVYSLLPVDGVWSSVAQSIAIILLLMPVIHIINRKFVWMTGKF